MIFLKIYVNDCVAIVAQHRSGKASELYLLLYLLYWIRIFAGRPVILTKVSVAFLCPTMQILG
jgi:hypothetical protein